MASNSYSIVLVVCDRDRKPIAYNNVVQGINEILGGDKAEHIVTFTRPCTLQVILYHFGDVELKTQSKVAAKPEVHRLTGIENYDAHQNQLKNMCERIRFTSWDCMRRRLQFLSTNPDDVPSSNMSLLFDRLCSNDDSWIKKVNDLIHNDE